MEEHDPRTLTTIRIDYNTPDPDPERHALVMAHTRALAKALASTCREAEAAGYVDSAADAAAALVHAGVQIIEDPERPDRILYRWETSLPKE